LLWIAEPGFALESTVAAQMYDFDAASDEHTRD